MSRASANVNRNGKRNGKKKKNKRSQAPVALIYFVTLIIFCGVFGLFAKMIIEKVANPAAKEADVSNTFIDSYNTLYARVNNKNVLSDLNVMRICPEQNRIIIIPMSALTVSTADTGKTFREVYEEGGIRGLQSAVNNTFGISTNYYVTLSNDAFEEVADIVGGFSYVPPEELYYLDPTSDKNDISFREGKPVMLSGRQIRLICQMSVFSKGRQGNVEFLGEALVGLINNAFDQVEITTNSLDVIYNKLTSNSSTNLSENDYKQHRVYIKDMLKQQIQPAEALVPDGTWVDEGHFKPSDSFLNTLYSTMEATKSQKNAAENNE